MMLIRFFIFILAFAMSLSAVDSDEEKLIELLSKRFMVVFDVGAHGGEWTDLVLKHNKLTTLHLFEPAAYLYDGLIKKYSEKNNIFVSHLGLSHTSGSLILYNPGSPLGGYHFRPGCHDPNMVENVLVTTVDEYSTQHCISHIDLLKIDTEGAELDILKGSSQLLQSQAIDVIQFEYGGTYLDAKITLKDTYEFLKSYGYRIIRIENGIVHYIDEWSVTLENYQLANYVAYNPNAITEL